MPTLPPRFCARCTENHLGPCPKARRQKWADYNARRGTSTEQGYGVAHRRWREQILKRDVWCVDCQVARRVTSAVEAHHLVKLSAGGAALELENGLGLCKPCHSARPMRGE